MRWPLWLGGRRRDDDIDEELAAHLAMATRDRIEQGMTPDAARLAAGRDLGNVPLIKQSMRDVWSWTAVEQALQDLRLGARIVRQSPGLSAAAVLLVALVVGANTTIYSMVNGMLVSPARGVTADRLVTIKHADPGMAIADPFVSFPNYADYARLASSVTDLTAWSAERLTLGTGSGSHAVFGALVTANYFDTLGVAVALGRRLTESDDVSRDGVVAIISDSLWRDRFQRAPDVIGRGVTVNGVSATIVGVAAPGFAGAQVTPGEDVWLPIRAYYRTTGNDAVLDDRAQPLVAMVGRRAAGASIASVGAEFDTLVSQLRQAYPGSFTTYTTSGVTPLANPRVIASAYSAASLLPMADMAPTFLALFSIVTALTVVVVSANVANLMLGRAVERQQDTAVRLSLGASRLRILRLLAGEGLVIAALAWAAACVVAVWTSRLLLRVIEPRPGLLADVRPDWTLALYAMTLAAVSTIAFTLAPALRAWRLPVLPLLRRGEASVAPGRSRLSSALVVLQLALSVVLLTGAGLAYRSLSMLDSSALGFDADRLLLVAVRIGRQEAFVTSQVDADDYRGALNTLERVRERLGAEPGVSAVSYRRGLPGSWTTPTPVRAGADTVPAYVRSVGPDFIKTLGLTARAGREFSAADGAGAPRTAVVSQHLADALFPGRSALGESIAVDGDRQAATIVGVVPNALFDGPIHDPRPRYVLVAQQQLEPGRLIDTTLFIRHDRALDELTPRIGRALADVDPALPIVSMTTMPEQIARTTALQAEVTKLVLIFALTALVVASLGQYAVAMFNMRRRTRDLGLRLALGASPARIQRAVVAEALALTVPGVLIGLLLGSGMAVAFRAALFGVTPVDPITWAAVLLIVGALSLIASYLPARRAARISVMEALRHE